jgi:hypothetical protein
LSVPLKLMRALAQEWPVPQAQGGGSEKRGNLNREQATNRFMRGQRSANDSPLRAPFRPRQAWYHPQIADVGRAFADIKLS